MRVAVSTAYLGRTSFAVDFATRRGGSTVTSSARIVYVVLAQGTSDKREIPRILSEALGPPAPLRRGDLR